MLTDCTGATDHGNHLAAIHMIKMQGGVFGAVADSRAPVAVLVVLVVPAVVVRAVAAVDRAVVVRAAVAVDRAAVDRAAAGRAVVVRAAAFRAVVDVPAAVRAVAGVARGVAAAPAVRAARVLRATPRGDRSPSQSRPTSGQRRP